MFNQQENYALLRLMRHALGYTEDSKLIAEWLVSWQENDCLEDLQEPVEGLSQSHNEDIRTIANAALREDARPTELGRYDYIHNMEKITQRTYRI